MDSISIQLPETIQILNYTILVNPATMLIAFGVPFLWIVCLWAWLSSRSSALHKEQRQQRIFRMQQVVRLFGLNGRRGSYASDSGYQTQEEIQNETYQEVRYFKLGSGAQAAASNEPVGDNNSREQAWSQTPYSHPLERPADKPLAPSNQQHNIQADHNSRVSSNFDAGLVPAVRPYHRNTQVDDSSDDDSFILEDLELVFEDLDSALESHSSKQ